MPLRCPVQVEHTGDDLHLRNAVAITENDADLRRGCTLLCKLANLIDDLIGCGLKPGWGSARVWDGGARYALRGISGQRHSHTKDVLPFRWSEDDPS